MTDPRRPRDIAEMAGRFGIEVSSDLVIDLVAQLFAAPSPAGSIVARTFAPHAITRVMVSREPVVFDIAESVKKKEGADSSATYTDLVKSGPNSWSEKNLAMVFDQSPPQAKFDSGDDVKGPVSVAMVYEKKLGDGGSSGAEDGAKFEKASRVVVFGDSDWASNDLFNNYANRDLVLNTLNWLVGEEGGVSIRPKSIKGSVAPISKSTWIMIFASSLVVPELILLLGLFIWWRRKSVEV